MNSSSETLGSGDFYPVLPKLGKDARQDQASCVEVGSNTSTVILRVVGSDEKGSLQFETVKYGHDSHGIRIPKITALVRARSNCKRQTRPLVRESVSHQQTSNCLTIIKIWS
jgi:hypothetical protein